MGDSYDYLGIAGQLIKLIAWRWLHLKMINPLHKTGELFCSEFVTTFLQQVPDMYSWVHLLNPINVAPGGSLYDLGTPSLQEVFTDHSMEVKRVQCPWE